MFSSSDSDFVIKAIENNSKISFYFLICSIILQKGFSQQYILIILMPFKTSVVMLMRSSVIFAVFILGRQKFQIEFKKKFYLTLLVENMSTCNVYAHDPTESVRVS